MTEARKYLEDNNYFELSGRETEMSKLMTKFADLKVKEALEEIENDKAKLLRGYSKVILGDNYEAFAAYEDTKIEQYLKKLKG